MFQPQFFYEAGKARSGTALIPFFDSTSVSFAISTRNGNTVVDWGDGSSSNIAPVKMRDYADGSVLSSNFNKSYSSALNGNVSVKFLQGLKDVYSVYLGDFHTTNQQFKLNILDVETFFHQFPNLFSLCIEEYAYQTTARMSVIKGDLAKLPNSVERVLINQAEILNAATDFTLNFSSYTNLSNLKVFRFKDKVATTAQSTIKVIGDVGKLPTSCQLFYLQKASAGSSITYTAGKVWASAFDTLYLPISLSVFENDNLLNDLKNSVTTAIGGKVIYLGGGYRSSASDSAVTYLTGLGFTISGVSVIIPLKILDLPLQNNFTDYSASGISMVAGGTSNQPIFALSGRKAGEYCAVFNGSQSIKTTTNLPINSDKVTVEFAIKTTHTSNALIVEMSPNISASNTFGVYANNLTANKIDIGDHTMSPNSFNIGGTTVNINDGTWKHLVMTIDRNLGVDQNKIYLNGTLNYSQSTTYYANLIGNFVNNILFIGQRNGNSVGFNGSLMYLKIYNYALTGGEASTAFNVFTTSGTPILTGKSVALIGDSTITNYACRSQKISDTLFNSTDISNGWTATNLAVAGQTISQQLTVWNNNSNKVTYDIIIIQVGLNDMSTATATTLTNYQNLINQINATKKAGAKVYISCMLPCKQRFVDLGIATGQSNWIALNNAIMGSTFTGVDGRNNYHVSLLDDGGGNLASAYDCGDHIHENQAGADIIIAGLRTMIGL